MFFLYTTFAQTTQKLWYYIFLNAVSNLTTEDYKSIRNMQEFVSNNYNGSIYIQFKQHDIDRQFAEFKKIIKVCKKRHPGSGEFKTYVGSNVAKRMAINVFQQFKITDIFFNYCFLKANNLLHPKINEIEGNLIKKENLFYELVESYSHLQEYIKSHSLLSNSIKLKNENDQENILNMKTEKESHSDDKLNSLPNLEDKNGENTANIYDDHESSTGSCYFKELNFESSDDEAITIDPYFLSSVDMKRIEEDIYKDDKNEFRRITEESDQL